jgi:hypothetical protein
VCEKYTCVSSIFLSIYSTCLKVRDRPYLAMKSAGCGWFSPDLENCSAKISCGVLMIFIVTLGFGWTEGTIFTMTLGFGGTIFTMTLGFGGTIGTIGVVGRILMTGAEV